jgi:hypothetical protein
MAVPAALAAMLVAALAGCGRMGTALSQQWMTVQFSPNTTMATVLHVRAACSNIQNVPPMALPAKRSVINTMYGVRFNTTDASPANLQQLQKCLQQFTSVLGINSQNAGDEGS